MGKETPANLRAMGKIIGTQDGEMNRSRRRFPNADAQRGYDEGYARGQAYAMERRGHSFLPTRSNPSDGMSMWEWLGIGALGAIVLYAVFKPTTETAIVLADNPNPAPVSEADHAVIRGIQDQLRALGYNPGPTTGDWNHDTNYALAFFQRAEGLPATGVLNGATATRLALRYSQRPTA